MDTFYITAIVIVALHIIYVIFALRRREKNRIARRDYYREYLKSDAWKRKRYVVLKRDNWKCQICGDKATQVHHLKSVSYTHLRAHET